MTVTCELGVDWVKMNHHANCQSSFRYGP